MMLDETSPHNFYLAQLKDMQCLVLIFITYPWLYGTSSSHLTNKQYVDRDMTNVPCEASTTVVLERKSTFEFIEITQVLKKRKGTGDEKSTKRGTTKLLLGWTTTPEAWTLIKAQAPGANFPRFISFHLFFKDLLLLLFIYLKERE